MKATHNITYKWSNKASKYELFVDGRYKLSFNYIDTLIDAVKTYADPIDGVFLIEGVPVRDWLNMMWNSVGDSPVRHEFWA